MVVGSRPVMGSIYDRLLFKNQYPKSHFQELFEGRSGTIGVTSNGVVFGGGVYDGRFNVDLVHDVNMIARPYALSAFHPAPHRVLMIGIGSGSWAQDRRQSSATRRINRSRNQSGVSETDSAVSHRRQPSGQP